MQYQQEGNSYYIDLVMCIDGTASMRDMINKVKERAAHFYEDFLDAMMKGGKPISREWFRMKVIVFRDYKVDSEPMVESQFFDMTTPEGRDGYKRFVMNIEESGGGDAPENALEAIYKAISSDWVEIGGRFRRHAILLFTDAPALSLRDKDRVNRPGYPLDAPATLEDLRELFLRGGDQSMSYNGKRGRLVVFAPEKTGWDWVRSTEKAYLVPTEEDGGCKDVDMDQALAVLVASF